MSGPEKTFGSSKTAIVLHDKIQKTNDKKISRKVTKIITRFFSRVKDLDNLKIHKRHFYNQLRTHTLKEIDNYKFPVEIETYMKNIVDTKTKIYIRNIDK